MRLSKLFKSKKPKQTKVRRYDGAAKTGRTSRWFAGYGDANAFIGMDLPTLRQRARDLRRNNPYGKKAIEVVTNNVIGRGIATQFSSKQKNKIETQETVFEQKWKDWAGSLDCDYDGRNNLAGLQRLAMDAVQESGEVLIRKRIVRGQEVPLQYQVLEGDFLCESLTGVDPSRPGHYVIQGIEFDKQGKRYGYHLYETHPGSHDLPYGTSLKTNFIPANEIYHLYRMERPGQMRGVPWSAACMIRLKDLDDFEDAQLMRQKVAACFTAFVHDISAEFDEEDNPTTKDEVSERIEPALIEHLPPGKTVTFPNPPSVADYKEFTSSHVRAVAAGHGITYEALSNDLSDVNFSSARMGWLEMHRNIESWQSNIIVLHMLDPIIKDFKKIMSIMGVSSEGLSHSHIPPRREMIDPTKEIPALVKAVRAGFMTRSYVIASYGFDPEEVYKGLKKDADKADELELILDSDPRHTSFNGYRQDGDDNEENNQDT